MDFYPANFDWRKLSALLFGVLLSFLQGFIASVFGPFFTTGAQTQKNLSKTQIGITFACSEAAGLLVSVLLTPKVKSESLRKAVTLCVFASSLSAVTIGMLFWVQNSALFFSGCLLMRSLLGASYTSYWVFSLSLFTSWYPQHNSKLVGINESVLAIGYMAGPIVGNYLVNWHGYDFLFIIPGGLLLFFAFFTWFSLLDYRISETHFQEKSLDNSSQSTVNKITSKSL